MITTTLKYFVNNWKRKIFSILLASIIWTMVNQSLTSTRTFYNVPIRVLNLPADKTIKGIQTNGRIPKKISLTLVGNKEMLELLQPSDLEVVIEASGSGEELQPTITKKNLLSLNPEIDINSSVSKVLHSNFTLPLSKLVTEKIKIQVTTPFGEAPRGYQFLDVWPYNLETTISGPEEVLKKIQGKEVRLTFNLTDISKKQLDALSKENDSDHTVISFPVPESWKLIHLPQVSDIPLMINDTNAHNLRIDFIKKELIALDRNLPIQFFYDTKNLPEINPINTYVLTNTLIKQKNGVYFLDTPLFAKGTDRLFIDLVKDRMLIVVMITTQGKESHLHWNVEFLNPQGLEDDYVKLFKQEIQDEDPRFIQNTRNEAYLRNRFRSYMNRFRLFLPDGNKLVLNFELSGKTITTSLTHPALRTEEPVIADSFDNDFNRP